MTRYRAVVIPTGGRREWVCTHKHRAELAAFDCALREVRRRVNRLLKGDPRPSGCGFSAQWAAMTREVNTS